MDTSAAMDAAETAAEAVRALNHHTLDPTGVDVAAVYACLGSLNRLCRGLDQGLDQLGRAIDRRRRLDVLAHDTDGEGNVVDDSVDQLLAALDTARRLALEASAAIDRAHQSAGHLIDRDSAPVGE
ncbi:MAG: hypothetical protein ACK5LS_02610 [Propioniciclava sp.]